MTDFNVFILLIPKSSEPVKRRKKPSGMKRRSASHSPSRKGRRTGRGRGSETDSEKDKKQSNRRKRGSIDGRTTRSEPVTGEAKKRNTSIWSLGCVHQTQMRV